jgi:hypothetical protein
MHVSILLYTKGSVCGRQDYPPQLIPPTGSDEGTTEVLALYWWGEKPIHGGDMGWLAEKAMRRKTSLKEMRVWTELKFRSRRRICKGCSDTVNYRNSLKLPCIQYLRRGKRKISRS